MKKTLYSLLLSDDVVREVDILSHRLGVSRSALVDRILAEYVSVSTPEQQINDIFRSIEALVMPGRQLVPMISPNSPTMALKSSLAYKYRPTVRYEVALSRDGGTELGTLNIIFRTTSTALLSALDDFLRLWVRLETVCLGGRQYALSDGRFSRSLQRPNLRTAEEVAAAITDYVELFDRLLKGYLAGSLSPAELEQEYRAALMNRKVLV